MNEDEARSWIQARFGGELLALLGRFVAMVVAENKRQNLIAPSTVDRIWSRHVADSAQLVDLAPPDGTWLDIGTGGGFPGFVIALVRPAVTHLVEPRRLRASFLQHCCDALGLSRRVEVHAAPIERLTGVQADVISARAVATPDSLIDAARHCSEKATRWILPFGRNRPDPERLAGSLPGTLFHVERSITDPESAILVAAPR